MRRRILGVIVVLLAAIVLLPSAVMARNDPEALTAKDVRELIQQFGPLVSFHPDEQYVLDTPETVLSGGTELAWGAVRFLGNTPTGPAYVVVTEHGRVKTSADTLLNDVAAAMPEPGDTFWLDIPAYLRSGQLQRAKAYVVVNQTEGGLLDLDFWFFYPYNGSLKARVNVLDDALVSLDPVGRHTGDWERVTVRLDDTSGDWALHSVFLSQHSDGQWLTVDDPGLTLVDGRPLVYAAINSHAFYPAPGEVTFRELPVVPGVVVSFVDRVVAGGATFDAAQPGNHRVVYSELAGLTVPSSPGWLFFEGRWGPYEQQVFDGTSYGLPLYPYVGSGPVGPLQH